MQAGDIGKLDQISLQLTAGMGQTGDTLGHFIGDVAQQHIVFPGCQGLFMNNRKILVVQINKITGQGFSLAVF